MGNLILKMKIRKRKHKLLLEFQSIALFDLGQMELRICGWGGQDTEREQRAIMKASLFPHGLLEMGWNFLCNLALPIKLKH